MAEPGSGREPVPPGDAEVCGTATSEGQEADVATAGDMGEVPDPDDDDLSDLDDMLEEFSMSKKDGKTRADTKAPEKPDGSSFADNPDDLAEAMKDDDLMKALQAELATLVGNNEFMDDAAKELMDMVSPQELAAMFTNEQSAEATTLPKAPSSSSTTTTTTTTAAKTSSPAPDESFQETIDRMMERMQSSGEQATAAATADGSDDFLAELMKQMAAGGDGGTDDDELSKMLMGMMDQLTHKEILYEPMKELNDKFPGWMRENREKVSKEDLKRYELQRDLVREIVARFEAKTYRDENAADREYIVERMQKMQASGSPPADLVGELPSADALNMPDEQCNPQ